MRRTNIYLADSQTAAIDRLAAQEGVSRAEVTRRLLARALAGDDDDLAADLAAIDDSFGAAMDIEVDTRAEDDRARHLAAMWRTA